MHVGKIPVRLAPSEARLIQSLRAAIVLKRCPEDVADVLTRLIHADLMSPNGKSLIHLNVFKTRGEK